MSVQSKYSDGRRSKPSKSNLQSSSPTNPSFSFRETSESMRGVKALVRDKQFTVDEGVSLYQDWVSEPSYLVMEEIIDTPKPGTGLCREVNHFAVKAAKRGNNVYKKRVKERFSKLRKVVSGEEFFDENNKHGLKTTRMLLLTLEFDSNRFGLIDSWKRIGEEFNRFMSNLRRLYGHRCSRLGKRGHRIEECDNCYNADLSVMRVWESHESGYPHVHALVVRETGEWSAKYHNDNWRLSSKAEKDKIADKWSNGFVDVKAVYSSGKAVNYLSKYLTKYLDGIEEGGKALKTLALTWTFGKRAFSCSRVFQKRVSGLEISDVKPECIIQIAFDGDSVENVSVTCLGLVVVEGLGDGKPPPFSFDVSDGGFEEIEGVLGLDF